MATHGVIDDLDSLAGDSAVALVADDRAETVAVRSGKRG
jgi:hypothetical protein